MTKKVKDALKDAKDSSDEEENKNLENDTINNQLNFFGDTLGKNIKENKYKNKNSKENKDENIGMIISGDKFDINVIRSRQSKRDTDLINNKIRNDSQESEDLNDSFCDNILNNMAKFRNSNFNDKDN